MSSRPFALQPHAFRTAPAGPVITVVMDGVGIGAGDESDAVAQAYTPTLDWLRSRTNAGATTASQLLAHGLAVGMPSDADMGNSEVGHNALGAGRIYSQGAKLVKEAFASGDVFLGDTWREACAFVQRSGQPIHFIGLLSDGNVHSHIDHLLQLVERCASDGIKRVRIHVLLDGRDVDTRSALAYLQTLETLLEAKRAHGLDYQIASGGGRMHLTMDRYGADWAMVQRGWETHVQGKGRVFPSAADAVKSFYEETTKSDQWIDAFVVHDVNGPVGRIEDGASVLFLNFRGDRAIEISRAFEEEGSFNAFDRGHRPDVFYAGMMQYDGDLLIPNRFLVSPPAISHTMGERLAQAGKRQLAIAETQKYGHVTYFWNGNRSGMFDPNLETYVEVPSDTLPFEQRPWMKAAEVTDLLIAELNNKPYDFVRVNYANGDMVGHTGDLRATRIAVEAVDLCLARLVEETKRRQGVLIVTADHGNADHMFDLKGDTVNVRTSHSLNPVPVCIFDPRTGPQGSLTALAVPPSPGAGLSNLASTTLELLGFASPEDFDTSLLASK